MTQATERVFMDALTLLPGDPEYEPKLRVITELLEKITPSDDEESRRELLSTFTKVTIALYPTLTPRWVWNARERLLHSWLALRQH